MNKKIGKSIIVGVLIAAMIFSVIGIIYTCFSSTAYAAENTEFYFYNKDSGTKITSVSTAISNVDYKNEKFQSNCEIKMPENTTVSDIDIYIDNVKLKRTNSTILTNANVDKCSVYSTEECDIELWQNSNKDVSCFVISKQKGINENLVFKISSGRKKYEATLNLKSMDAAFRFALNGEKIKEYTGKYAFEIGKEYSFEMNLPSGYTMENVEMYTVNNDGYIEYNEEKRTFTAIKKGSGRLAFRLKEVTGKYTYAYTNFEVVKELDNTENNATTNNSQSGDTNLSNKVQSGNKSIKFSEDKRIVTLSISGSIKIYETPTTVGIKKDEINYTVSDSSIASVTKESNSNKAVINIKKAGTFTLIATCGDNISAEKEIVVYANTLNLFESGKNSKINEENVSLNIGESFTLSAFEEENEVDTSLLKYTSSNEKVCTIDENGKITALKKGSSTIKVMLKENTKTYAKVYVKVSATKEEQMAAQPFSFAKDENGNVINYTGKNALILGNTYTYDLIRPDGTENYEVTYSCSKSGLVEIDGEKITPIKSGTGKLIAKMKIGSTTKTASVNIEIFANEAEKNGESSETSKYLNVEFLNSSMVVEKGNATTLKPTINTNMKKSEYTLNWESSDENVVKVDKNGRITAKSVGTATVTVSLSDDASVKSTITVEVKEKVVLVSSLKFNTSLEKSGSTYLIKTNESVNMNFDVKPENATLKDYSIEVDDKENFIVQDKTVIALKEGVKTKLTARSLDSGNKITTITLQSVMSSEELSNLELITDKSEIIIQVGETLKFKKADKTTISKTGNISCTSDNDGVISITGNRIGVGEIRVKQNNKVIKTIPVNIIAKKSEENDIAVKSIELSIDSKTSQVKNYTTDYPLVVDKCYNIIDTLSIYPTNATNKDINVEVSDKNAFTVTPEGNIIANQADASTVVTLSSVSNPEIVTTFEISSVSAEIKSIKFVKDYVGEKKLTLDEVWGFNLIITLDNGDTLDPTVMSDPYHNEEYQKYLKQIVIESSDTSLLEIDSSMNAKVVVGKNGTGTLTAYVKNSPNIKTTTKFETVGINEDTQIKSANFARSSYDIALDEGKTEFCPIITLANNFVYDPSKDYGKENSVSEADDYRNYVEQLEIEILNSKTSKNVIKIANTDKRKLSIIPKNEGTCELILKLKSTGEELSRATIEVKESSVSSSTTGVTGTVTEINHATTTSNKNLKITNIKFVESSYVLTGNYATAFQPEIKLSDGSTINHKSEDRDTYLYYVSQTELFFVNETNETSIDFGLAEIVNNKSPREVIPLKNGKFNLAIGLKNSSSQTIYDTVSITIKI